MEYFKSCDDMVDEKHEKLRKNLLNSKLITDDEWNEYQQLKSKSSRFITDNVDDYLEQSKKANGFDTAYAALEELEVTIKLMRDVGYSKDGTGYWATGKTSEFGVRAEVLLDEIEMYKRKINRMVGDK